VDETTLQDILASITPDRIERLILRLTTAHAGSRRAGVSAGLVVDAIIDGYDTGSRNQRLEIYTRLKDAVKTAVAGIDGMRYIESDA